MVAAAAFYQLPPRVLPSIQAVEGGRPALARRDADGTYDLGVMQVNTRWVLPLARYTGLPAPVVRGRLLSDPCFNIAAAAAIVRTWPNEHGSLMRAVGEAHAGEHVGFRFVRHGGEFTETRTKPVGNLTPLGTSGFEGAWAKGGSDDRDYAAALLARVSVMEMGTRRGR